jgi:hypothetical protein
MKQFFPSAVPYPGPLGGLLMDRCE